MEHGIQDACATTLFTIGHSTLPLERFLEILKAYHIERLIDIRTVPRSRTNPQFNRDTLPEALAREGIGYEHLAALGGLRRARSDSINTGWRNLSFRGYADYMAGADFREGLDRLIEIARCHVLAIMCAEAVPWRCHRSLVADMLLIRGFHVKHIMSLSKAHDHVLTKFALVTKGSVSYPAAAAPEDTEQVS